MTIKHARIFTIALALLLLAACAAPETRNAQQAAPEPHRPYYHFTPPAMWMNDPNGLVHYDGEYHLFYQFYPRDTVWGPMHWGHAVSTDLVNWRHLPIALEPDEHGYIFSGSAVVDWDNSSGFGRGDEPPLVAIFTYHDAERGRAGATDHETQGLAFSNDKGRTWTTYAGNPVLPNTTGSKDFRDPDVFWHEDSDQWVMTLSVYDHVQFWGSPDLKAWSHLGDFGQGLGAHDGTWECPDLFPITVEGTDETKWALILNLNPGGPQGGSGTQYFVGDFDGRAFTLDERFRRTLDEQEAVWLDWGRDNYAGVTWSDVPADDGRRLFIGWMSNWDYAQQVPTASWRSAMTVPRSLQLVETGEGFRLHSRPVRELETLRTASATLPALEFEGEKDLTGLLGFPPSRADLELAFDLQRTTASRFGVVLSNGQGERYRIGYDATAGRFFSDRREAGDHGFSEVFADRVHAAPRASSDPVLDMRLLLDVASMELFADGGATVMTEIFFPSSPFDRIALFAEQGEAVLAAGEAHALRAAAFTDGRE